MTNSTQWYAALIDCWYTKRMNQFKVYFDIKLGAMNNLGGGCAFCGKIDDFIALPEITIGDIYCEAQKRNPDKSVHSEPVKLLIKKQINGIVRAQAHMMNEKGVCKNPACKKKYHIAMEAIIKSLHAERVTKKAA